MAFEKFFAAVSAQTLTADGATDGTITLADALLFKVGQRVNVESSTETLLRVVVIEVPTALTLVVGAIGVNSLSVDVSAFTTADSATIFAEKQPRPPKVEKAIDRAVFAEEPAVAIRVLQVDAQGDAVAGGGGSGNALIEFELDGSNQVVLEDTVTPANDHPLPVKISQDDTDHITQFQLDGSTQDVIKDTVTPSNNRFLPVELPDDQTVESLTQFQLDGSTQTVVEDSGTPANDRPLPVKIQSGQTDALIEFQLDGSNQTVIEDTATPANDRFLPVKLADDQSVESLTQYQRDGSTQTVLEDTGTPANDRPLPVKIFADNTDHISQFTLDGSTQDVIEDTGTPANNRFLPVKLEADTEIDSLNQFQLDGSRQDVIEDTVTPSNNRPLPVKIIEGQTDALIEFQRDGANQTVIEDTGTPANDRPLPVKIFADNTDHITQYTLDGSTQDVIEDTGTPANNRFLPTKLPSDQEIDSLTEFTLDGSRQTVIEDTATPANNRFLPVKLADDQSVEALTQYQLDGSIQTVVEDTGTPANDRPLPVKIFDDNTDNLIQYTLDGSTQTVLEDTVTPANDRFLPTKLPSDQEIDSLTEFTLDGSRQTVIEDTATPANTRPLPVKMISGSSNALIEFDLDGSNQVVTEDTVTPANNQPLPTKLVSDTGDVVVTISDSVTNTIVDAQTGADCIVTQTNSLKVAQNNVLVGEAFGGHPLSALQWVTAVTNGGTQVVTAGQLELKTNGSANATVAVESIAVGRFLVANFNTVHFGYQAQNTGIADNVRRFGAYDPTNVSGNGVFVQLNGTAIEFVLRKNGVDTITPEGSFNGTSSLVNDGNVHVIEFFWNAGKIEVRQDNKLIHTALAQGTPFWDNPHLKIGMENFNENGGTADVDLEIRAAGIYRNGEPTQQPQANFIASGTLTLKEGPGHLHRIIVSRTGGGGSQTVTLYDNTAASGTIISVIALESNVSLGYEFQVNFNVGLTVVLSSTAFDVTVIWD